MGDEISRAYAQQISATLPETLKYLTGIPLLLLDDFGSYYPHGRPWLKDVIYEILAARHERNDLRTILTVTSGNVGNAKRPRTIAENLGARLSELMLEIGTTTVELDGVPDYRLRFRQNPGE
jgi:hypothetical protein